MPLELGGGSGGEDSGLNEEQVQVLIDASLETFTPRNQFGASSLGTRDFIHPGVPAGAVGTTSFWHGVVYYFEWLVDEVVVLDAFAVEVLNTKAGAEAYFALYPMDADKNPAGPATVKTSSALSIAAPAVCIASFTPVTIQPGRYMIAGRSGNSADGVSVRTIPGHPPRGATIVNGMGAQPFHGIVWAATGTAFGALPDTPIAISNYPYSGSDVGQEHFIFPRVTTP